MPRRCVVRGCHQKYKNKIPHISTFKFPINDPELLQSWIYNLNRPNWKPTIFSGLCANHFRPEDFRTSSTVKRARLNEGAIPTIFPHLSKQHNNLATTEDICRDTNAIRIKLNRIAEAQKAAIREADIEVIKFENDDLVMNYTNFKTQLNEKLNLENYYVFANDEKCIFYQIENSQDTECAFTLRISINNSLKIRILIGDADDSLHFERLGITYGNLNNWSQMVNVLDTYRNGVTKIETDKLNIECLLKRALRYLSLVQTSSNCVNADKLDIIINQLENSMRIGPKYNSRTIKMAFLLFSHSHATLELLRNFLYLPSSSYLQHLSRNMLISKNFNITTKKDCNLSDAENYVALLIDELYIDRSLQFNDDKLVGRAIMNPAKDPKTLLLNTKTILTFTIKSIFGNLEELVRMSPAIYPFGDVIYSHTKDTIDYVQKMGFNVKLIIADTSKNTQKKFQRFSEQNHHFTNPKFLDHQTYLQYDVLQILKDIRNDWLDLFNADRTFIYPDIETFEIKKASFHNLEKLFESDKLNEVKKAPKLTEATLKPSDNDKQNNINLVRNIFHESTILALREDNMSETADFCATIKRWCDIVITNEPILLNSDQRFRFLENFVIWIKTWRRSRANPGRLKSTTFHSIETTTKTLIELIKFSFSNCQAEFLCLIKLQKDSTENRFRFYESKIKSTATQLAENTEELEIDEVCTQDIKDEIIDPLDCETYCLDDTEEEESVDED